MQIQESNTLENKQVSAEISYTPEQILEIRDNILKTKGSFDIEFKPFGMQIAVEEANTCLSDNNCGPFGACILFENIIIGLGHNKVIKNNDPTCHAEVDAIRYACSWLKTYDLTGCVLYSSCQPCPMCLTACKWANIERVYYANTKKDAEAIGFRDNKFYNMIEDKTYYDWSIHIDYPEALSTFNEYAKLGITY